MSEYDISKEYLEQEYIINKKTIKTIADELKISDVMIGILLRQYTIPIRPTSQLKRCFDNLQSQEIIELYKKGWQCTKIAKKYNTVYSIIYNLLKRNGVILRDPKTGGSKLFGRWKWDNKQWLESAYNIASTSQIAKYVNCSTNVIREALLYYNIQLRTNQGPLNRNLNPLFIEYPLVDSEEFKKLYNTLSNDELIKHYNRSQASIASLCIEFDVIKQNQSIINLSDNASKASKIKWNNQEFRTKVIDGNKRKWLDEEYRRRMAIRRSEQGMNRLSKPQKMLYDLLDDLNINYNKEGKETIIGCYPLDAKIPNYYNNRHLLIEVQSYWHTLEKQQIRDQKKFEFISEHYPNYDLLYVWEKEFKNLELLKDKLLLKLQPNQFPIIDYEFKSLLIRDATVLETKLFIDAYHYIGSSRYGKSIVACHDDKIIAMAVYTSPVRQNLNNFYLCKEGELIELARFAIHPQYRKKNLASWFISKTLKLLKCKKIIAFADTTVGHLGTIYKASNFHFDHKVKPDYLYLDHNECIYHKKTIYNQAKSIFLTEKEYAENQGLIKIYGGEKLAYVYNK